MRLHLLFTAVSALGLSPISAAELTPAQFRKFLGRYVGEVSGVAGNAVANPGVPVRFTSTIRVTAKSSELLAPLIKDLHALPTHRILWRKPTGTSRRAVRVGVYVGNYVSSDGRFFGPVTGTRRLVFTDRGPRFKKRYVARLTDTLKEDGYSGQSLSGAMFR